eukprot:356477_1
MAQDPDNNYDGNSSEGPVTTDEEEEERIHEKDMKEMQKKMKLMKLHRTQNRKRQNDQKNKAYMPALKTQTKKLLNDIFHLIQLSQIITFNDDKTFTLKKYTFSTNILNPYVSITWKDNAYVLSIKLNRAIAPIMRWRKDYLCTYDCYRQKDSEFYFRDLQADLLDHVNIIKFDYLKHCLAMLINCINTPIGPVVYFKYDTTIKDKKINEIINELKEKMIMKKK